MTHQWDGAVSAKFGKTKRLIDFKLVQENSSQGLYSDVDAGIEQIKGRRHYDSLKTTKEYQWRSSIKKPEIIGFQKKNTGVRRISPIFEDQKLRNERRHVLSVRRPVVHELFTDTCEIKHAGSYIINNRIW